MEALLKNQKEDIAELTRLIRNYKADGSVRKTKNYLEEKLQVFERLFIKIRATDNKLDSFYTLNQPYWAEDTFKGIEESYRNVHEDINKRLKEIYNANKTTNDTNDNDGNLGDSEHGNNGSQDDGNGNTSDSQQNGEPNGGNASGDSSNGNQSLSNGNMDPSETLMIIYNELMDQIIESNMLTTASGGTIRVHLELLNVAWNEFRVEYQRERLKGELTLNFNIIRKKFVEASGKLNDLLRQTSEKSASSSNIQFSLPQLKLPEFTGKPVEWKAFISLYDRMVHDNNKIDSGLKIEYLKTCIKGDAAKIINHIDATPENYTTCYTLLRKRYDNKREMLGQMLDNILTLPRMKYESFESLKLLHDTVYENIMSIRNINVSTNNWDPLLTHILIHKLDSATLIHYECQLRNVRETQSLETFLNYVESRFMALQSANAKSEHEKNTKFEVFSDRKRVERSSNAYDVSKVNNCVFCNEGHSPYKCPSFLKKSPKERFAEVKQKRLCTNCFSSQHKVVDCKSKHKCKKCDKSHNTLLHFEAIKNVNVTSAVAMTRHEPIMHIQSTVALQKNRSVLLATAIIGAYSKNGNRILLHALFDQGSESAFITEEAAQTLGLTRIKINANVSGIGARTQLSNSAILPTIFPRFESDFAMNMFTVILSQLTHTSIKSFDNNEFEFTNNLTLADPSFLKQAKIDIILGAAEYAQSLKSGLIKSENSLIAQNTEFGWIISGAVGSPINEINVSAHTANVTWEQSCQTTHNHSTNMPILPLIDITALVSDVELSNKLKTFFAPEEFEENEHDMTEEEAYCEKIFNETTYRNEKGQFVVSLPFKNQALQPELGDSRKCAIASQLQLERRFQRNPSLRASYDEQIREALSLKHIEEVPFDASKLSSIHYIPHHCIFKDSTTTAMRIVHNASQKTSNGKSLNEQLAIGRIMQNDLMSLLMKFRTYKYAFTADVEKMYKQILVNEKQVELQRFVYRFSPNEHFRDFRLKTVIFGMSNAPYLAIRVVRELAERVKEQYPLASAIILSSMYVDDVIGGCHTVNELCESYDQLKNTFNSALFNLRKWSSNSIELLNHIPEIDKENNSVNARVKALGIHWETSQDIFTYCFTIDHTTMPTTKRQLTSEIASLFDPLGWISPVILSAKRIVQLLWQANCDWDETAPEIHVKEWLKIKNELGHIANLKIPRFINFIPGDSMELHGFCDASEVGYAAAIYVKNKTKQTVNLLAAKARVTPVKEVKNSVNVTIPRLELSAAVLLALLTENTIKAVPIQFERICLWSDSRIVLDWLHADPKKYKSFISSRIEKIRKHTALSQWSHVRSEDNAADCASRGLKPSELKGHPLWWHGPEFLLNETLEPPRYKPVDEIAQLNANVCNVIQTKLDFELPNVSTFKRLTRSMAYVFRFVHNCKNRHNRQCNVLSAVEMKKAENLIVKYIQNREFSQEISALSKGKVLPRSSKLLSLSPFLDENGLLRVGGRIGKSELPYDARHQLLLPKKHPVTNLIINNCHLLCFHGGPKLTESTLRQKYWVCNSQRTIKSVLKSCMECFRVNPKPMQPYMADLPLSRLIPEKPFAKSAVDYTGTVFIKVNNGRGYKKLKAYISIFVCMVSRAIHIEAVSDMTAEAFIAAFRRFVARRGAVRHIYSDNGTNFVSANKILQNNMCQNESEYNEQVLNEMTKNSTTWHFSPPGAPHFNGLAEAGVKTVKRHIKATISDTILTFEELSTLLAQIEGCVNSRPLCAISSDPNDVGILTPAHFLVGEPLVNPPEPSHIESKASWLTRWQRVQKMAQYFWQRWSSDVLNQWQMRQKWKGENDEIKMNDLVLIKDENLPPCQWKLGRVIDLHPGDDGLIRVVTLRCQNNVFKRPIVKLCPLPMKDNDIAQINCEYDEKPAHLEEDGIDDRSTSNSVNTTKSDASYVEANHAAIRKKQSKKSFSKFKPMSMLPVITALLALTVTFTNPMPMREPVQIERFNASPGIYFEKNFDMYTTMANWNVLAFLNLNNFRMEFEAIKTNLSSARAICYQKLAERVGCRNIISHLDHRLEKIGNRNSLIQHPHRAKRATLDIIGNIASDLFGIAGPRFVEKYSLDMQRMSKNENVVKDLLSNHTSIMESTLNVIKHDHEEIEKQAHHFNVLIEQIRSGNDLTEAEQSLNDALLYMIQVINEYEKQQQSIMQVVSNSRKNLIDHNLLTVPQIDEQVDLMMRRVAGKYIVPTGIDVYAISRVTSHLVGNQYVFKISIPLLTPQLFKVYQIIPVPILNNNEFLWVTKSDLQSHLIVSDDREMYRVYDNFDHHNCQVYQRDDLLICDKPKLWFNKNKQCCVWNVFNEQSLNDCSLEVKKAEPTLIEVNDNVGIFVFPKSVKIQLNCDGSTVFRPLVGEGIVRIRPDCTLRGANSEFTPTVNFENSSNVEVLVPQLVLEPQHPFYTKLNKSNESRLNEFKFSSNLTEIYDKLNITKKQLELVDTFNGYDIHHFSITYLLVAIIMISSIIKLVRWRRKHSARTTTIGQLPAISMPNVTEELEVAGERSPGNLRGPANVSAPENVST